MMRFQAKTLPSKIGYIALFTTLALIFSYVEAVLPFNIMLPGVKLGIANLVILVALYSFDVKSAFLINLCRILLAGFLFSGFIGLLYSLVGGMLSLGVMALLKKSGLFSIIGVSIAGAIAHNLGQILMASFIISNLKIFVYFPVLIFSGLITGAILGMVAHIILKKLN